MLDFEIINNILSEYSDRRSQLIDKYENYENELNLLNNNINKRNISSDDIKFFTPFSSDELYENRLDDLINRKNELSDLMNDINSELLSLNDSIEKLQEFIVSCETINKSIDSSNDIKSNYDFDKLIHKLQILKSFIFVDDYRAKQFLDDIILELLR